MKKLLFILLAFAATSSFAQNRRIQHNLDYDNGFWHWGFQFGFNSAVFQPTFSTAFANNDTLLNIHPATKPGFQFGFFNEMRLHDNLTFRVAPTLYFMNRNLEYTFKNPGQNIIKRVETINMSFPLLFKYRSNRVDNFRMYMIGGMSYNFDMSSEEKVRDELNRVKVKRNYLCAEYGIGADIYFPYFKFSPEIRIQQSVNNVLIPESHVYSASFDKLMARAILISFHFQ